MDLVQISNIAEVREVGKWHFPHFKAIEKWEKPVHFIDFPTAFPQMNIPWLEDKS